MYMYMQMYTPWMYCRIKIPMSHTPDSFVLPVPYIPYRWVQYLPYPVLSGLPSVELFACSGLGRAVRCICEYSESHPADFSQQLLLLLILSCVTSSPSSFSLFTLISHRAACLTHKVSNFFFFPLLSIAYPPSKRPSFQLPAPLANCLAIQLAC